MINPSTPRHTALHNQHEASHARMVDFSGWSMPLYYSSILEEHQAVRKGVGIFDISHMGEFFVTGSDAETWLESLLTNRVGFLGQPEKGEAQYTLMLNAHGGVIDDLILYRLGAERFFLIVNASKIEEDEAWMLKHKQGNVRFENRSVEFSALAIQGPLSPQICQTVLGLPLPAERNRVLQLEQVPGLPPFSEPLLLVTTGYTGEIGFEVIVSNPLAPELWQAFLAAGVTPCGLGARDTLRLEMAYPLNGSDLTPNHTPLEAGLAVFVDLTKPDFIGKDALLEQKTQGIPYRLAALTTEEKTPPLRAHYPVLMDGQEIGETCSGAFSPSLGRGIALAYLPAEFAKIGTHVQIRVRDKRYAAQVQKKPFLKKA